MPYQPLMPPEKVGARRSAGGGVRQKYFLDDRGRRLIMDLYDGTKERTDIIQKHMPHIPRPMISRWAMQLGKVHPRDHWTKEEEAYLHENIRKVPMYQMEEYLKKDRGTIARKALFLGMYKEGNQEGYTMDSLALCLGILDNKKIKGWVDAGWLKGEKRTTELVNVTWHFTDKHVRAFIFEHPLEIDPRKADWLWLIDLLRGPYGIGRLDNPAKGDYDEQNL